MRGAKLTKIAVRKIEIATRAQMRERIADSAFLRKSLNIYNGHVKRALDLKLPEIDYTVDEFRAWLKPLVGTKCECGVSLTLKRVAVDHNIPISRGGSLLISNLVCRCKSCNWRKGILLPEEFGQLVGLLAGFTAESRADVYRRLTLGGKWSFK